MKSRRRVSQQVKVWRSVRKLTPPASVIIPDPKQAAKRRRIKRLDPNALPDTP